MVKLPAMVCYTRLKFIIVAVWMVYVMSWQWFHGCLQNVYVRTDEEV